jgi:UDP-N-acetylmuramate--alanine ligase
VSAVKPHLHFMGIGGVGMSGLAQLMYAEGYGVSGCDASDGPQLARLRQAGIDVQLGHHPDHLADADVLVTTMAVPETCREVQAARALGRKVMRRIDLLAEVMAGREGVGVTGTHGKSTTTAMTATVFLAAGADPAVLVGGELPLIGSNVRSGAGPLIAEVDESDPGFQGLACGIAVVTNLEDDHIAGDFSERRNYHATLGELVAATRRFASQAGQVLYCADWPGLAGILGDLPQARAYGFGGGADYRVDGLALEAGGSSFRFHAPDGSVQVALAVPGRFNVQNAAAALACAHLAGLPLEGAAAALALFRGVGRRWQRWGSVKGALIIDDYAHHPTEIGVTLEAAKHTGRRVRAVVQPHRWVRTARHWPAIAEAAAVADEVIVLDVYAAGEESIPGISPALIVERLRESGKRAQWLGMAEAERYLAGSLAAGDLVITLGAGDVWKVARGVVQAGGGDDGSA